MVLAPLHHGIEVAVMKNGIQTCEVAIGDHWFFVDPADNEFLLFVGSIVADTSLHYYLFDTDQEAFIDCIPSN